MTPYYKQAKRAYVDFMRTLLSEYSERRSIGIHHRPENENQP